MNVFMLVCMGHIMLIVRYYIKLEVIKKSLVEYIDPISDEKTHEIMQNIHIRIKKCKND